MGTWFEQFGGDRVDFGSRTFNASALSHCIWIDHIAICVDNRYNYSRCLFDFADRRFQL